MASLVAELNRVLRKSFPSPDRIRLSDEDGIIGAVISSRFKGMESMDRINWIWDILEKELSAQERRHIVSILAVTPQEEIMHTHQI